MTFSTVTFTNKQYHMLRSRKISGTCVVSPTFLCVCFLCVCMFKQLTGSTAFLPAYTCHTMKSPISIRVCSQCRVGLLLASSAVTVCYVCICECTQYVLYSVL